MKRVTCLLIGLWLTTSIHAQGVFSNQTNIALKKVIEDYRYTNTKAFIWNRELHTANNFNEARLKFSELYQQIHNTIIKIEGEKPVILNGAFEMPDKSKKQNIISFHFLPAIDVVQKLKVELVMTQSDDKYTISLQVYEPQEVDFRATVR